MTGTVRPASPQVAILGVGTVLKQLKRKHPKREMDVEREVDQAALPLSPTLAALVAAADGGAPPNLWLQFNSGCLPDTRERWDRAHFVHKTHVGFLCLPKPFLVYAPEEEQPKLDRTPEEMSPVGFNCATFAFFRTVASPRTYDTRKCVAYVRTPCN